MGLITPEDLMRAGKLFEAASNYKTACENSLSLYIGAAGTNGMSLDDIVEATGLTGEAVFEPAADVDPNAYWGLDYGKRKYRRKLRQEARAYFEACAKWDEYGSLLHFYVVEGVPRGASIEEVGYASGLGSEAVQLAVEEDDEPVIV